VAVPIRTNSRPAAGRYYGGRFRGAHAAFGARRAGPAGVPEHAIAMHGEPALPAGFDRLRYANPTRQGGR